MNTKKSTDSLETLGTTWFKEPSQSGVMGMISDWFDNSKRVSFGQAVLRAVFTFVALSLLFNAVVLALHWVGLARFAGGLLQGAAVLAMLVFAMPIAVVAGKSTGNGRPVILAAGFFLVSLYFAALYFRYDLITAWLYPHWPGQPTDLSAMRVFGILIVSFMLFGIAYWAVNDLRDEPAQSSPETGGEVIGEVGEGVIEGVGHQLTRPSGSRGPDIDYFDGLT